jgi:hypothetical protein
MKYYLSLLVLFIFPSLLSAVDKRVARLVEPVVKSGSSKSSVLDIQKTKSKKESNPDEPTGEIINYEKVFESKDFVVKVRARKFKQGELMMVRLFSATGTDSPDTLKKYTIRWMNKDVHFYKINQIYTAFIPIHPEQKVGTFDLEVRSPDEGESYKVCPIEIEKAHFVEKKVTESLKLPKKFSTSSKGSPETYAFIEECEKMKRAAYQSLSEVSFSSNFQLPAKIKKITSNFYARRNYFKKKGKPHGGIDLRGNVGDPIHAIQDGKVLIARPMYFEGIFTLIDHGGKIFSLYMHQSETLVKEGQYVKKGDLIGKIGSTGMSTGPHLHLGLKVDNVIVNPMSAIQLKIF